MNICLCFKKGLFTIPFFLLHLSNLMLGKIKNKVLPFSRLCMKIVTHIHSYEQGPDTIVKIVKIMIFYDFYDFLEIKNRKNHDFYNFLYEKIVVITIFTIFGF